MLAKELLRALHDAFQFQKVLESNGANGCVKFSQHSGLLCYSAVTGQVLNSR